MSLSIPLDTQIDRLKRVVKRGPYIDYSKDADTVKSVINILKQNRRGDIQKIAKKTGYKATTLYEWRQRLRENPDYNPLIKETNQNKRIFNDKEEDAIADFIFDNVFVTGKLFMNLDFKELAMDAFLEKHLNDEKIPNFNASDGFVFRFKQRHRISSRKCHLKRRPPCRTKEIDDFLLEMQNLFDHPPDETEEEQNLRLSHIVNCDETNWVITPKNIKVWHPTNHDHVVRYANSNDKESLTVVAAIAANGTRLPLQFIAKGTSEQSIQTQIGDFGYHTATYSENGWTTIETFKTFLNGLRAFYGFDDPHPIHLVLDAYQAHLSATIREEAENLNIKLHFIPAGMTDFIQPLDVSIFGPLKRIATRLFQIRVKKNPDAKQSKRDACQDLICAWEKISPRMIQEGFCALKHGDHILKQAYDEYDRWEHHVDASKLTASERKMRMRLLKGH